MSELDERIRKGQAINLAVQAAIDEGCGSSAKEIYKKALMYYDMITAFQEASLEDLRDAVKED